jgi:hypothetical protein
MHRVGHIVILAKYNKAYFKVNFLNAHILLKTVTHPISQFYNERHRKSFDKNCKNIFVHLMYVYKKFNENKIK